MEKDKKINNINSAVEENAPADYNVKESDPGAARQGNFINYYQFNPPSERLSLLFPEKLLNKLEVFNDDYSLLCLDVGCNSGVSTTFSDYLI